MLGNGPKHIDFMQEISNLTSPARPSPGDKATAQTQHRTDTLQNSSLLTDRDEPDKRRKARQTPGPARDPRISVNSNKVDPRTSKSVSNRSDLFRKISGRPADKRRISHMFLALSRKVSRVTKNIRRQKKEQRRLTKDDTIREMAKVIAAQKKRIHELQQGLNKDVLQKREQITARMGTLISSVETLCSKAFDGESGSS